MPRNVRIANERRMAGSFAGAGSTAAFGRHHGSRPGDYNTARDVVDTQIKQETDRADKLQEQINRPPVEPEGPLLNRKKKPTTRAQQLRAGNTPTVLGA